METINLGSIKAEVLRKRIKHMHLGVFPPEGLVRISAPEDVALDTIRVFAISKLGWIKSQQRKMQAQPREPQREFIDRESHYVWGRRYLLQIQELAAPASIVLSGKNMRMTVRPGTPTDKRQALLEAWYRTQVREAAQPLLRKWQAIMGVQAGKLLVQRMKTKWGSCNPKTGLIRLNTDLAKKPPEHLEYVIVHELAHLIEASHGERFVAAMDMFLPKWQHLRDELNSLPVRHEVWG
ncbi:MULTISPECIES: M48 family metallopeptidase [Comamonas]|uniref:M48 family metallopeptidase n=1 Tax=Comamonas TaxID=283 RepID=UPI0006B88FF3|nr:MULTISPECIES: SprT family zinc-dependent metalloprotease [Comamonas]